MDKAKKLTNPLYLTTKDIKEQLQRIDDTEKLVKDIDERMKLLEEKIDKFLSFEKEKYKRILNDLKSE